MAPEFLLDYLAKTRSDLAVFHQTLMELFPPTHGGAVEVEQKIIWLQKTICDLETDLEKDISASTKI